MGALALVRVPTKQDMKSSLIRFVETQTLAKHLPQIGLGQFVWKEITDSRS